jgi:hypothetical protein
MLKVLVQKGHVSPREPGFEGGTGTVKEQELVSLIGDALAALLNKDGRFEPIVVPGDIPDGIKCDAAIFLHGDGSVNPFSTGYCFGYPEYGVNKELADLIAVEFDKIPGHPPHRQDNYTGALRQYYGYSRVNTPGPEVLVEHGFLTNPGERLWLFANVQRLAVAEYRALCAYFGFRPKDDEAANVRRRATLRAWILRQRALGKSWAWIKKGPNWREFRRRGGK